MRGLWDKAIGRGYRLAYLVLRAWWLVYRPATHGVCVALWHGGKVLLIRTIYRNCYSLPGGFVKRGEPSEQAARRELQEEVGVDLSGCELRLVWSGTLLFESRQDTVDIWETALEDVPALRIASHELAWADWVYPADALGRHLLPHVAIYLAQRGGKGQNGARA